MTQNVNAATAALMAQLFATQAGAASDTTQGAVMGAAQEPAKKRSELIIRIGQTETLTRKDGTAYEAFISLPFDIFLDTMGEPKDFGNGPLAQASRVWRQDLLELGMSLDPGEYRTLAASETGNTEVRLYRIEAKPEPVAAAERKPRVI